MIILLLLVLIFAPYEVSSVIVQGVGLLFVVYALANVIAFSWPESQKEEEPEDDFIIKDLNRRIDNLYYKLKLEGYRIFKVPGLDPQYSYYDGRMTRHVPKQDIPDLQKRKQANVTIKREIRKLEVQKDRLV